jgi:hypothetical protein
MFLILQFLTMLLPLPKSQPTYIGLYMQRTDEVKKQVFHDVLIIASLENGHFVPVEDKDLGEESDASESQRAKIIKAHPKYISFTNGSPTATIYFDKTVFENFDCSRLVVGRTSKIQDVPRQNLSVGRSGFIDGKDISYSHGISLAMNSSSLAINTQTRSKSIDIEITSAVRSLLRNYATKELKKHNKSVLPDSVHMSNITSYSLGSDSSIDYIFSATAETKESNESIAFVARVINNTVNSRLLLHVTNEPSSWGNGYELLDVLDIDGDQVPELIFKVGYYEATGFEIYKMHGNNFKKVFEIVPWGC